MTDMVMSIIITEQKSNHDRQGLAGQVYDSAESRRSKNK